MNIFVKIIRDGHMAPGKLADAELHFNEGALAGLKLIGFAIWERRGGPGRNVTFPARQYSVDGERRSFALLRPIDDVAAQERVLERVSPLQVDSPSRVASALPVPRAAACLHLPKVC